MRMYQHTIRKFMSTYLCRYVVLPTPFGAIKLLTSGNL